jgi:hypothetical protein
MSESYFGLTRERWDELTPAERWEEMLPRIRERAKEIDPRRSSRGGGTARAWRTRMAPAVRAMRASSLPPACTGSGTPTTTGKRSCWRTSLRLTRR